MSAAIEIEALSHRYGAHEALSELSLSIETAEIFAILGPNGGGKTTLFRLLSTLIRPMAGGARIFGCDVWREADAVRRMLGVVFQAPSLDPILTVRENLRHQGHLFGFSGSELRNKMDELTERFGLMEKMDARVATLSGGLARRVEIVKALLHSPDLLLLDEPSTGLDPGIRADLWKILSDLRGKEGVTVVLTTHIMDEAEKCDRVAILDRGKLVTIGTPNELKEKIRGEVIDIHTANPLKLAEEIRGKLGVTPSVLNGSIQIEHRDGQKLLAQLYESFSDSIEALTLRKPTLDDVFVHETGHRFREEAKLV